MMSETGREDERVWPWLRTCGWYPGRDIGLEACGVRELIAEGYQVSAKVQALLREFGDLDFSSVPEFRLLWINGRKAVEVTWPQMMHMYSAFFGRPMVPVGEQGLLMVMADLEGGVWVTNDEWYEYLGPNFCSALSFFGRTVKQPLCGTIPAAQYDALAVRYYGSQ